MEISRWDVEYFLWRIIFIFILARVLFFFFNTLSILKMIINSRIYLLLLLLLRFDRVRLPTSTPFPVRVQIMQQRAKHAQNGTLASLYRKYASRYASKRTSYFSGGGDETRYGIRAKMKEKKKTNTRSSTFVSRYAREELRKKQKLLHT